MLNIWDFNTETIVNKFNEYMFEYTSKIPMDEIEKASS